MQPRDSVSWGDTGLAAEKSWQIPGKNAPRVDSTPRVGCQSPLEAQLLQGSNQGACPISGRETQPRGAGTDEVTFRSPNTEVCD